MDTKENILNSAQRLIQQSGVNGFSYADIAAEIGIRKASLHHHYATKTDLVKALIERYTDQAELLLMDIARSPLTKKEQLEQYIGLYRHTLAEDKVCVGGMLSAEMLTLDNSITPCLTRFFNNHVDWVAQVLTLGEKAGEFQLSDSAEACAKMIVSTLQGALMVSRGMKENSIFEQTATSLLASLLTKH